MARDDEIVVKIILDDKKATKSFDKIEKRGKKAAGGIQSSFAKLSGGIAKNIKGIGAALVAIFTVKGLLKVVDDFRSFEKALIGVAKTTNIAKEDLAFFGARITQLTKTIPLSTVELLRLAKAAGQLGVRGNDLIGFTEAVAKLSFTIDDVQLEDFSRQLTRILKLSGENVKGIKVLGDVFTSLGNSLEATEAQILRVTSEISRNTAAFKFSSGEVTALGGALAALGVKAESGGSSVGLTLSKIEDAVNSGGKSLEKFAQVIGTSTDKLRDDFGKDSFDVFVRFVEGLNRIKLEGESVSSQLKKLGLDNIRVRKTIIPLAERVDIFRKSLKLMSAELAGGNATEQEFVRATSTLDAQLILADTALTNFSIAVGALANEDGVLRDLVELFKDATIASTDFINSFRDDDVGKLTNLNMEIDDLAEKIDFLRTRISTPKQAGQAGAFFQNLFGDPQKDLQVLKDQLEQVTTTRDAFVAKLTIQDQEREAAAKASADATRKALIDPLKSDELSIEMGEIAEGLFNQFDTKSVEGLKKFRATAKAELKQIVSLFKQFFAKGVSDAFASFGKAISRGESGMKALSKSVLSSIGSLAIMLGQFFILVGAGLAATETFLKLKGSAAIGAGIALSIFGGVLQGLAGGSSGGVSGAGGGGTGSDDSSFVEPTELEAKATEVTINVEGTVLDPKSVGLQIAEILEETFDSTGVSVVGIG